MEKPQENIIHIDDDEDRITYLPKDVMQCIIELLPLRDAARTCVLSTKWRYVWSDHPSLLLHMHFWDDKSPDKLDIVSSILLLHFGHVRKFVIDVPEYVSSNNLDLWLTSLCRRRLEVLHLKNSIRYQVPYSVLLSSELTDLSLYCCYIPKAVGCFTNIQRLILDDVQFYAIILKTPLLTCLTMKNCFYTHDFQVSAPKLASLTFGGDGALNMTPFLTCTDIDYAFLFSYCAHLLKVDGKHLVELLACWPKISVLVVDGHCFKKLATGSIPDNDLILPLNLRRFALRNVSLDSELIAWILYVLKNSPFLQTFEIWFDGEEVMNDINEPSMTDLRMDQLRTVIIKDFTASRNKVMFVNILFKCAPLLEKLIVEENEEVDLNERMKILKHLFTLQKKYRNTDIVFAPNLVSAV